VEHILVQTAAYINLYFVNSTILMNLQFAPSFRGFQNGYLDPLNPDSNALLLPYYFINESTDAHILEGLKCFKDTSSQHVLNFRGSIVRALSLGYMCQYDKIIVTRLDLRRPWKTQAA